MYSVLYSYINIIFKIDKNYLKTVKKKIRINDSLLNFYLLYEKNYVLRMHC